jgi:hypothetical protein
LKEAKEKSERGCGVFQPKYQLHFNSDDMWQMHRLHFHEDVEILLSLSSSGDFFIEIGNAGKQVLVK